MSDFVLKTFANQLI